MRRKYPEALRRILQGPITRRLRQCGASVVMAPLPNDVYLVASFLAARTLGLPFYAHMHDLWAENTAPHSAGRGFAETWEPVILAEATRVVCMTEAMQQHYAAKYGIKSDLMPHCVGAHDEQRLEELRPPREGNIVILFVGAVSPPMNLDALKVLAAAADRLPPNYELLFCTPSDQHTLQALGIRSARLHVKYVSRAEVQRLQSEAHVLVAPLSHKNGSPHEVRTVFSTKLLEYLVAGRPILVFAPDGSHHAESARRNGWGYVVSEDSPTALAAGLVRVATEEGLAARLVRNAWAEARSRSPRRHAARLREWVAEDAAARRAVRVPWIAGGPETSAAGARGAERSVMAAGVATGHWPSRPGARTVETLLPGPAASDTPDRM
jgi:glycosyltransferase involved in cell wall biosynthesis